jgi:hypothetical protein
MGLHIAYDKKRGGTVPTLDISERSLIERIVAKDGLKFSFIVWLAVRLTLSAWGILVMTLARPDTYPNVVDHYPGAYVPNHDPFGYALGVWNVYDTQHYISIANNGYEKIPYFYTAFFPGFPLLIKLVSLLIGGQSLLAALLVTNISALIFFWYLYRLVEADYGQEVAKRAVIISAVFPTSFFLFMGYTESPLLAFTVAAFYYGRQQKWWLAGILAGCAALIKQPGIFLLLPLGYMYWRQYIAYRDKRRGALFLKKLEWAWLLLIPIAALGYMTYRYLVLSTPSGGVADLGAGEQLTLPGLPLVRALLAIPANTPFFAANLLDIIFAVAMIVLVSALVIRTRSKMFALYSVPIALISLCVTYGDTLHIRPEIDMPRRILILFPIFIYLALALPSTRAFRYFAFASILGYLFLTGLFIDWFFVA